MLTALIDHQIDLISVTPTYSDAAIGTGIAVDKMLALTGQAPLLQIANIWMPSEAEREERRAMDDKLDAIARRLADARTSAE